ncbi:MAG: hypothetical protein QM756_33855 [Polyangiaceae bacterium]
MLYRSDSATGETSFSWVLPQADWVWNVVAADEAQLLARVRRLLPSLRAPATPDAAELAEFGPGSPRLAAAFSLAAIKEALGERGSTLDTSALPFGGSSRVVVRVVGNRVERQGGPLLTLELKSRWSPAAIADLVELVKSSRGEP